jgi:hypothetical protein
METAMTRTIEVEIDEAGAIRPLDPTVKLPPGRAVLAWPERKDIYPALMSEKALADWLRSEEDEAWALVAGRDGLGPNPNHTRSLEDQPARDNRAADCTKEVGGPQSDATR